MKRTIYTSFILFLFGLSPLDTQGSDAILLLADEQYEHNELITTEDYHASTFPVGEKHLFTDKSFTKLLPYILLFSTTFLLVLAIMLSVSRKKIRLIGEELKRENREIQRKNKILKSLHEKTQIQHQEIDRQRSNLEDMNRIKDKMFSIIAHDFRSPLNTIQGTLNLLHQDVLSQEELKGMLPQLSQKLDHSINLLDNLLNWARTQMNGLKINKTPFSLNSEIHKTIGMMVQLAQHKNIQIQKNLPEKEAVFADPDMIQVVIRNLLSNAIKFTETDGLIQLSARRNDESVIVSVSDTGVGMDPRTLRKIFDQTGHTTVGTAYEKGTGLGLVLCHEFVRRNGGKIWVESKVNKGTTFYFSLPVAEIAEESTCA